MEPELNAEAELIRRAANGNAGAFSLLVRKHHAQVVRIAYGLSLIHI